MKQDVLGLDVPMDDVMAVRVVERARDLPRDANGFVDRQMRLAFEPVAQRFAFDIRHHVEHGAVGLAGVVQRQDVRSLQVRRRLDLGEKAFDADDGRELRPQHLQRDAPIVALVAGEEDRGHAALSKLTLDDVPVGERFGEATVGLRHGKNLARARGWRQQKNLSRMNRRPNAQCLPRGG